MAAQKRALAHETSSRRRPGASTRACHGLLVFRVTTTPPAPTATQVASGTQLTPYRARGEMSLRRTPAAKGARGRRRN